MTAELLGYVHLWRHSPRAEGRTLLLLHGTGGDEHDLVPLARVLDPDAHVLSPRGNVLEGGMPRFFRRHAVGVLDIEDLHRRTHELARFVEGASDAHDFPLDGVTAVGFSNGANIAAGLLFETPHVLDRAILLRAMLPYRPERPPEVKGKRVLLLAGERDPYSQREATEELARVLRDGGAQVDVHYAPAGHELVQQDVEVARAWLAREGA